MEEHAEDAERIPLGGVGETSRGSHRAHAYAQESRADVLEKSTRTPFKDVFLSSDIPFENRREVKECIIFSVDTHEELGRDNPFQTNGEYQELIRDNFSYSRGRLR